MYQFAASQLLYVTPCAVTAVAALVVPEAWLLPIAAMVRQLPRLLHALGHEPGARRPPRYMRAKQTEVAHIHMSNRS